MPFEVDECCCRRGDAARLPFAPLTFKRPFPLAEDAKDEEDPFLTFFRGRSSSLSSSSSSLDKPRSMPFFFFDFSFISFGFGFGGGAGYLLMLRGWPGAVEAGGADLTTVTFLVVS